jgi:hypothetical protein
VSRPARLKLNLISQFNKGEFIMQETISEYKLKRKINTARTIFICISVISFALLIIVVALPAMNETYDEKAEKEAIRRMINFSKNMDEDMAASLSAKKNTDNAELP